MLCDEDRERLSNINKSMAEISSSLSAILKTSRAWEHPTLNKTLTRNVVDTIKEVQSQEAKLIAQKDITREELYQIGKVYGRMEGIYHIIMNTTKKRM